jgi:hypothetical protein
MTVSLSFCLFLLVVVDMVDDLGRMGYGCREALRSSVHIERALNNLMEICRRVKNISLNVVTTGVEWVNATL